MKYLFFIGLVISLTACKSQNQEEFVVELDYYPEQREGVDDQEYRKWTTMLKNSYEQIKEDSGKVLYADHLNLATAYINLREPKNKVLNHWRLAQEEDIESTAEIFPMIYGSSEKVEGYLTASEYDSLLTKFATIVANKQEIKIDPTQYAIDNNLNSELVNLMAFLKEKDQEFRMADMSKQQIIDERNIEIIDSLYSTYGKYIGKSLVGNEYQSTMFLLIQHSDLDHQESYLPVIHQAVVDKELHPTPLKMLIDRVYKKKYGYQIFGSQAGGELADDATIEKVKSEYGL